MTPEDTLASMEAVVTDFFYWMSIALMICIHAGFLAYEVGASRSKNVLASAMKNLLTFAVVIATFFFFGRGILFPLYLGITPRGTTAKVATAGSTSFTLQCSGEGNGEVQGSRARQCRGQEGVGRGTARLPPAASWRVAGLLDPCKGAKKIIQGVSPVSLASKYYYRN